MKVIDIDNTSIYLHKYNNVTYKTEIQLDKSNYLAISFNESNTLYEFGVNTKIKHPLIPYANNMWYVGKYYKHGSGIGEIK